MIARALAQDTDLMILDEPTAHLDLRNRVEVMDHLKELSKSGKTILISTHEIALAAEVCKEFWCMDGERDFVTGTPSELLKNGVVQEFLQVSQNLKAKK
ncbi:MAG: hypothetical protein AAF616_13290 [Bacteroidota bacterium]